MMKSNSVADVSSASLPHKITYSNAKVADIERKGNSSSDTKMNVYVTFEEDKNREFSAKVNIPKIKETETRARIRKELRTG